MLEDTNYSVFYPSNCPDVVIRVDTKWFKFALQFDWDYGEEGVYRWVEKHDGKLKKVFLKDVLFGSPGVILMCVDTTNDVRSCNIVAFRSEEQQRSYIMKSIESPAGRKKTLHGQCRIDPSGSNSFRVRINIWGKLKHIGMTKTREAAEAMSLDAVFRMRVGLPLKKMAGKHPGQSGFRYVRVRAPGRFVAQLRIKKKQVYLGTFDTAEAAHDAAIELKNSG